VLCLGTGTELDASWRTLWEAQGLTVSRADTEGRTLLGTPPAGGVTLTPGQSRILFVLSASGGGDDGAGGMPRAALAGGLLLASLLTLGAAYGVYRTTTRELLLARQQSDFVSAVSHEFRTPLTSMRHLTDLAAATLTRIGGRTTTRFLRRKPSGYTAWSRGS